MFVSLSQNKVKKVLAGYEGDRQAVEFSTRNKGGHVGFTDTNDRISLNLETCPHDFLDLLLKYGGLTETVRATIISETGVGGEHIGFDRVLTCPLDLYNMIATLGTKQRNAEMFVCGRWYPVTLFAEFTVDEDRGGRAIKRCTLYVLIAMAGSEYDYIDAWSLTDIDFKDSEGPVEWSGEDLFQRFGLRRLQTDLEFYDQRVTRATQISNETGALMDCVGPAMVLETRHYQQQRLELEFGTHDTPKKVIIDKNLEQDAETRHAQRGQSSKRVPDQLPFVRVFHMEMKRWGFVDELDLEYHECDTTIITKLVVPHAMQVMLHHLFKIHTSTLFGDILREKSGGMIMLANGPSGVGKTLTAEVFAEVSRRPLYVMEMVELGAEVKGIEEALQRIFRRVTRWNAILLMDECDVFLSTRGTDMTQNVVVGIFLRLMDYYKGLMFLTSNRAEVIDPAFKSRITLQLDYPPLNAQARMKIWRTMLKEAGLPVTKKLDKLAQHELNGRQIRNLVRLMRAVHGTVITYEEMESIIQFACK